MIEHTDGIEAFSGNLVFWSVDDGMIVRILPVPISMGYIEFSSDGRLAVIYGNPSGRIVKGGILYG